MFFFILGQAGAIPASLLTDTNWIFPLSLSVTQLKIDNDDNNNKGAEMPNRQWPWCVIRKW